MNLFKLILFLLSLGSSRLLAQTSLLDSTFNGNGLFLQNLGNGSYNTTAVVVQPDGKIIFAGARTLSYPFPPYIHAAPYVGRLLPQGIPDPDFGNNGFYTPGWDVLLYSLVLQPDGKILVGGQRLNPESGNSWIAMRLLPNGAVDTDFGAQLFIGGALNALCLQPDGKILTGGGGWWDAMEVIRLLPDGGRDSLFGQDGYVATTLYDPFYSESAAEVALQPDGKIVVSAKGSLALARYHADGTPDSTFGTNGIASAFPWNGFGIMPLTRLAIQTDGKIIAGCNHKTSSIPNANYETVLARFTPDGSPDTGFGTNGLQILASSIGSPLCTDLALQPDGKIILSGAAQTAGSPVYTSAAFRCLPDGSPDTGFGAGGLAVANFPGNGSVAQSVALQPDGKIVLAGSSGSNVAIARLLAEGTVGASSPADAPLALRLYPNPCPGEALLEYHLDGRESVLIRLLNAQGQVLNSWMESSPLPPGDHVQRLVFPVWLPEGTYFLYCSTPGGAATIPVCLKK